MWTKILNYIKKLKILILGGCVTVKEKINKDPNSYKGKTIYAKRHFGNMEYRTIYVAEVTFQDHQDHISIKGFCEESNTITTELLVKDSIKIISKSLKDKHFEYAMNNFSNYLTTKGNVGFDIDFAIVNGRNGIIRSKELLPSEGFKNYQKYESPITTNNFLVRVNGFKNTCFSWGADAFNGALNHLKQKSLKDNHKVKVDGVVTISKRVLSKGDTKELKFNSDKSINVYGKKYKKPTIGKTNYRALSGYLTFGVILSSYSVESVKALDKILGVVCVSLFSGYDTRKMRRVGNRAGDYKQIDKDTFQYRTLSAMISCHPMITHMVVDMARTILNIDKELLSTLYKVDEADVIKCINNCDVKLARSILKKNKKFLDVFLLGAFRRNTGVTKLMNNIILKGIDVAIENPKDVLGNWKVGSHWTTHSDGDNCSVRTSLTDLSQSKKI